MVEPEYSSYILVPMISHALSDVQGSRFRVQASGFRVEDLGFRVQG